MPAIPGQFLDCAIYLYPSVDAAEAGEAIGGSGFLVSVPMEGEPPNSDGQFVGTLYAVTNRHVADQARAVRLNNRDGAFEVVPVDGETWVPHPDGDDVAVAHLGLSPDRHRFLAVSSDSLVAPTQEGYFYFARGTDTFMVGRFVTHEGKQRNTPTVRFGNVSMLPEEPLWHKKYKLWQDSFLVEVRSLPGYSGSPVFGYVPIPPSGKKLEPGDDPELAGMAVRLIGVDWCHLRDWADVYQADEETKTGDRVALNSGMAGVIPAWKLTELLEDDELARDRKQGEDDWRKQHGNTPAPQLDEATGRSEFERFEDLTRKLVNTPKSEVDEKRRAEKQDD
ncbi:MAG: hypothetical protein QOD71_3062 [Thermoleophilaceae bacterium]|jgi:hypothetical protein|nr:hypothetical protein [Thermoleophilaceae bacterium]